MADFRLTDAPSIQDIEREIRWERAGVNQGIRRYRAEQRDLSPADRSGAQRVYQEAIQPLIAYIDDVQNSILDRTVTNGIGGDNGWWTYVGLLDAATLAYLTLRAIFSTSPTASVEGVPGRKVTDVGRNLVTMVQTEIAFLEWVAEDREAAQEAKQLGVQYQRQFEALRRRAKKIDTRAFKRWMKRLERAWKEPWPETERTKFGGACIQWAVDNSGGLFELQGVPLPGGKTGRYVLITDRAQQIIDDHTARAELLFPLYRPMKCQPKPWLWDEDNATYNGGYYLHDHVMIRSGYHKHSADLSCPLSRETLQTVNVVQSVPWRVNSAILATMQDAWNVGAVIGGLPSPYSETVPDKLPDAVWEGMSDAARVEHKMKRMAIHDRNASATGRRHAFSACLDLATDLQDEPSIWFPHFADFRGRLYPIPALLSPQGDDVSKSLLMFAEGKPLGDHGLAWLCVRAANCYASDGDLSLDKLPINARIEWALDNLPLIQAAAADPLGERWWTQAEDPWCFLATCFELAAAAEEGVGFVSHLPIPLDGSCNGLQHLAAMGCDPAGAAATNVLPGAERRDIYSDVAARVTGQITVDAGKGNEIAALWLGNVGRKTVKRAVMTTPYGVTPRGVREQLLKDGHVRELGGSAEQRSKAADYLRDRITDALTETVVSAKQIMAWLQTVAGKLAEHDTPFRWETPTGNVIQQSYWDHTRQIVQTLAGKISIQIETPEAGLRKKKQMLAAAPNVIHSFDASHLVRTVNRCAELGITSFAMIHDSFGTHAADTGTLSFVLREEFARIYRENWLQKIEDYVRSYSHNIVEIPSWTEYVTLGDLDVDQVVEAEFFFA